MSRICSDKTELLASLISPIIVLVLAVAMYAIITFLTPDEASERLKNAIVIYSAVAAFISMILISAWMAKKLPD